MTKLERKFRKMALSTLVNLIILFRKDLSKKEVIEVVVYNEFTTCLLAAAMCSMVLFAVSIVMLAVSIVKIIA